MSDQEQSRADKILGYSELGDMEFYFSAINEFFFTFLFLVIASNLIIREASMTGLQICCGFGFVLAAIHFQASKMYGCHLNPALTFGHICWGNTPIIRGLVYMLMQVAGGIVGFVRLIKGHPRYENLCCEPLEHSLWVVIVMEVIVTHVFVYVAAYMAREERRKQQQILSSFFCGLMFAGGYMVTLPITAGGINPARCIGPAVWLGYWHYHWVFWAAQLFGGLTGVGLNKAIDKETEEVK